MTLPPPMPTLLELLTPLSPKPKPVHVRKHTCASCNTAPRKLLASGRLDPYCVTCRREANAYHQRKIKAKQRA